MAMYLVIVPPSCAGPVVWAQICCGAPAMFFSLPRPNPRRLTDLARRMDIGRTTRLRPAAGCHGVSRRTWLPALPEERMGAALALDREGDCQQFPAMLSHLVHVPCQRGGIVSVSGTEIFPFRAHTGQSRSDCAPRRLHSASPVRICPANFLTWTSSCGRTSIGCHPAARTPGKGLSAPSEFVREGRGAALVVL